MGREASKSNLMGRLPSPLNHRAGGLALAPTRNSLHLKVPYGMATALISWKTRRSAGRDGDLPDVHTDNCAIPPQHPAKRYHAQNR